MNFHKLALKNITASFKKGSWIRNLRENKEQNFMNTFVGRRLLHRHIIQTGNHSLLNGCEWPDQVKKAFFTTLALGAKHAPHGAVVIDGDMTLLQTSDWLDAEHHVLKQLLHTTSGTGVDAATLLLSLKTEPQSPKLLRKSQPKWLTWLVNPIFNIPLGTWAYVNVSPFIFRHSDLGLWEWAVHIGYFTALLAISGWAIRLKFAHEVGTLAMSVANGVSNTWEETLAMHTAEDAILLGLLIEIIITARQIDPKCVLPDFLRMTPQHAYLIATRLLDDSGCVSQYAVMDMLSVIQAVFKKQATGNNTRLSVPGRSYCVNGVNLSELVRISKALPSCEEYVTLIK